MGCFVVTEFLLTSVSRGPSAIAELLVFILHYPTVASGASPVILLPDMFVFKCTHTFPNNQLDFLTFLKPLIVFSC